MNDNHALQAIGWPLDDHGRPAFAAWREMLADFPTAYPARVVEQHRTGYVVAVGPEEGMAVESPPHWQRAPSYRKGATPTEQRAGVGDWVLVEPAPEDAIVTKDQIVALLPRRTAIKRGAAGEHYKQQLIAANVDTVFVVCGLDSDFNPRRIERYLLLVSGSGAVPVVVLTKLDQADDVPGSLEALIDLAAQDVPVRAVNALDPDSVASLNPWLRPGTTAVLVGSSGAGKSTLTNTLVGSERMKTGAVRESDERGRHTTTHRALIPLESGACLIDTPGMRELKPTGEEDVAENFSDIDALGANCRFRDCRHASEPDCAIRAAIEDGKLDPRRFANYVKLQEEVAGAADKLAERQTQHAAPATNGAAAPPLSARPARKPVEKAPGKPSRQRPRIDDDYGED
ncbi:ribosome small subunit-dependent GTPase A [Lysobacter sp. A03]|uniref:ribosome small subunit-dependent GTPase A n=1 Tax=Lysobacter sp. A03 TaxID=1199154 RepID=UPI0005B70B32|nr:ribosome small subunit-dependent GTPase A [Lysobacter sp. A03]KIQ97520.1 putative GTPase [Lysobacter sp. A03]